MCATFPCAFSPYPTWNANAADNAIDNTAANPNVFWQPTSAAAAPLIYEVDLGASTTLSAVTTTWYAGFAPPSAYTVDTSLDGVTWTTQVTAKSNTAKSRTDVLPGGQATAHYLRLDITAFPPPCAGCGDATLALVQIGWDGHNVSFPQAYYPATQPNSATADTTSTWDNRVPDNIFSGGPGGTSWWQPAGASGNVGNLIIAVDLGSARTVSNVAARWLDATHCPSHVTCTGFNPINYKIFTSPNGRQNSWTSCATVTSNASFSTRDTCAATNVVYVEYVITRWNAPAPFGGSGPAADSLTIA